MAAAILQVGGQFGICEHECPHRDCDVTRDMATQPCRVCGEPIGFGRRFYRDDASFAHASCAEDEAGRNTAPMAKAQTKQLGSKTYRIDYEGSGPVVQLKDPEGTWRKLTRSELLAYKPTSRFWLWLYDQGITRPSPSGPAGPQTPHKARQAGGRVRVEVYLSPEGAAALEQLTVRYGTKTSAIERALLAMATPEKK